jgi:UDP-N-acetyl-D-glucosamine:ribostamycin N-acetyl-D-glucosaminyltransferase
MLSDAGGAARPLALLFERYGPGFDLRHGGGVERALYELGHALAACGAQVHWYTQEDCPDAQRLAAHAAALGADAVFPLCDSALFWRQAHTLPASLRATMVRIWHDVGALTQGRGVLAPCPRHGTAQGADQPCGAAHAAPEAYAADVFFRDDAWTRCFPRRHTIPWAVDHLPARDYRDPAGPILLLAGKSQLELTAGVVAACRAAGVPVRVIFSGWSSLGRQAKAYFQVAERRAGCEVIDDYCLEEDHARVFGGISAAFVLSQYHETFNFLAAECVHFGLPVVALSCSGATRSFAALALDTPDALRDTVASGRFRTLAVAARPPWGWRDVAAAYIDLAQGLRGAGQVRHALST